MFFIYKNRKIYGNTLFLLFFFRAHCTKDNIRRQKEKKRQPRERVAPNTVYRTAKSHGDIRPESCP